MRRFYAPIVLVSFAIFAVAVPAYAYIAPVDAPVVDGFRPPSTPYGAGNRGFEYATEVGNRVVASDDGVVTFAGSVGGKRFVTIQHADGLRTSYGYLLDISVRAGDLVVQGQLIGTAKSTLQFDVRQGDEYIDPGPLLTHHDGAHLVPLREE